METIRDKIVLTLLTLEDISHGVVSVFRNIWYNLMRHKEYIHFF